MHLICGETLSLLWVADRQGGFLNGRQARLEQKDGAPGSPETVGAPSREN